jgi:sigma-B regulation protein RsbU (phosphoserine phosphatase)
MDYTCCVCLDHLSTEETRSLERELELAQNVQRSLLPQHLEDIPGLEIAAFSRPAQIVGGDYFDFFAYANGANGVAIADVAGHGVSASLLMSSVQTLLRTLAPAHISPAEVTQQIHHLYRHNIRFTTFVTLFMGAYDVENHIFMYCNAGHNPPLVIRKALDGKSEVAWLQPTGPAVGLVEEAEYGEETVGLSPGDVVLMYTDGVTEAINSKNEEFGQERLAELAKQHSDLPAKEALGKIRQGLRAFTEGTPLEDDTTIVIFRIDET